MDRGEVKQAILDRYQKPSTDTKFVAFVEGAIQRVMERISIRRRWWFMQATATLVVIADQFEYRIGNPEPTAAPTAADSGSAGNPDGAYQYRVSFVNAFGESNPSPKSVELTVVTNQITLSNVPVADSAAAVTGRRIYRNAAGGDTWYIVGTIGDNTTTTFTDNVDDVVLITNTRIPSQHIIRPLSYMWHLGLADATDVTVRRVRQGAFRKIVPDSSANTGDPEFVVQNGSILQMYPLATTGGNVTYPYFFKWRKLQYDSDMIPEEIPAALLHAGVDMECTMYLNKENRWWQEARAMFEGLLSELEDEHIRQMPPPKVVSEDETEVDFMATFPNQDMYKVG